MRRRVSTDTSIAEASGGDCRRGGFRGRVDDIVRCLDDPTARQLIRHGAATRAAHTSEHCAGSRATELVAHEVVVENVRPSGQLAPHIRGEAVRDRAPELTLVAAVKARQHSLSVRIGQRREHRHPASEDLKMHINY